MRYMAATDWKEDQQLCPELGKEFFNFDDWGGGGTKEVQILSDDDLSDMVDSFIVRNVKWPLFSNFLSICFRYS